MKKILFLLLFVDALFANVNNLNIDEEVFGELNEKQMRYYKLEAHKGESITATLDQLSADGDIYIKIGSKPTLKSYDERSINVGSRADSVTLSVGQNSTVYIAVYAFKNVAYHLHSTSSNSIGSLYGEKGSYSVEVTNIGDTETVIYHPSNWASTPTPVIFFSPGFLSKTHQEYSTLLNFIASKGYSVIYVPDHADITERDIAHRLRKYEKVVEAFSSRLDHNKIGMIGFSAGGGIAFSLLTQMLKNNLNWGSNGKFLTVLEPWFSFGMSQASMATLTHTNVLFLQFGKKGSNSDPRIALNEYKLLTGIASSKRDYQVYEEPNIDHYYPRGSRDVSEMQGVLKPLDALMAYTFKNDASAYDIALNQGNDRPYSNGLVGLNAIENYAEGGCRGEHPKQKAMLSRYDIDYCSF